MKLVKVSLIAALVASFAIAESMPIKKPIHMPKMFQMVPLNKAEILQKGPAKLYCPKCGMTLNMFYKTNHAAKVNGKIQQFCSIHCLAEAMNSGAKVSDIKVVDNTTLKFIPVSKAWYVVGSSKPGTMSKVSKYAFGTKEAALKFAKEYGGKVMKFDEVLDMVKKNLAKESQMIAKKQMMMAKKGEMIYNKKCQKIDKKFNSVAEVKAYITKHKSCGNLKGKALQAVGIYLKNR